MHERETAIGRGRVRFIPQAGQGQPLYRNAGTFFVEIIFRLIES